MDGSWWRGLTEYGLLEKGLSNHFSILALNPMHSMKKSLSPVQLFATPWTAALQASLSVTNSRSLLNS